MKAKRESPGGKSQADYGLILAQQVLVFMTSALTAALLGCLLGFAISGIDLALSVLLSVLFGYCRIGAGHPGSRFRSAILSAGLFGAPFLSALAISLFYFDTSSDGQYYHQIAVIRLAGGWNPLREICLSSPEVPEYIHWFSKAPWILAAVIYKGTGLVESGKAVNLLLMAASFFSVRAALKPMERVSGRARNVLALLLALNPVATCQMFSFMVDGALSSLVLILLSQLLILLRRPTALHFVTSGMAAILLINAKYSGLPYALFLVGAFLVRVLFRHRDMARKAVIHAAAILVLGVFVYGYNPYVTNTVSTGNPFYGVIGEGATNTVDGHVHDGFLQKSRFEKLFLSLMSKSMNSLQEPPELKLPFTVSPGEIIPFFTPDTRIGGWGPLFGGVFILAAAMLLIAAFARSPYLRPALLAGLVLSGSVFIFPEPWWARYAPQVWVLPFVPILLSYYAGGAVMRILRTAALIALSVNVLFVMAIYTGAETWASLYLHRHLSVLSQMSREKPLPAAFQLYDSNRVRLQEAGVRFQESSVGRCADPIFFDRVGRPASETATLICADREEYGRLGGRLLAGLAELRGVVVRDVLKGGATTDGTPLIRETSRPGAAAP